jgi:hypothetical protein
MAQIRERGIYLAPNGRHFVASALRRTGSGGKRILSVVGREINCFLFDRYQWAFHGAPDYAILADGLVLPLAEGASWISEELVDTGITAGAH